MITIGAMFWGMTGPMIEWMLKETALTAPFMLAVRLVIAGIFILVILKIQHVKIYAIWKMATWRRQLILFSTLGMLGLQYTFVFAIKESNAVVATLLQFLAPIFIIMFVSLRYKSWPPRSQIIGIIGTLFGLFLLLTNGSLTTLVVSEKALLWGVALGFTYAFYTLYPVRLMKEWGVLTVVGWGMIISGICSAFIGRIWQSNEWQLLTEPNIMLMMAGLIILGAVAFILFLSSMKYISAVETSILSSFEPLTAMVVSAIWLGATLQSWQFVGVVLMLIFITYLSIAGSKIKQEKP